MEYSTQVKPISYLKSHTAEIVTTLTQTREPLLITQNGEAKLVVMDVNFLYRDTHPWSCLPLTSWKSSPRKIG